jgi:hypothetical protein
MVIRPKHVAVTEKNIQTSVALETLNLTYV